MENIWKFIQNQNPREMIDVEAKSLQSLTCQWQKDGRSHQGSQTKCESTC